MRQRRVVGIFELKFRCGFRDPGHGERGACGGTGQKHGTTGRLHRFLQSFLGGPFGRLSIIGRIMVEGKSGGKRLQPDTMTNANDPSP
jgi:hypothetical protein